LSCSTAGTHDDTKGVIRNRIFDEGQTTQWPKEKGQKEQTTIYKTYIEN